MVKPSDSTPETPAASTLRPLVRFLLWDYHRGSPAYEVALILVILILLLVPGGYWGDPLWSMP